MAQKEDRGRIDRMCCRIGRRRSASPRGDKLARNVLRTADLTTGGSCRIV